MKRAMIFVFERSHRPHPRRSHGSPDSSGRECARLTRASARHVLLLLIAASCVSHGRGAPTWQVVAAPGVIERTGADEEPRLIAQTLRPDAVDALASPDDRLIARADRSAGVIRVWDRESGLLLREIFPHEATPVDDHEGVALLAWLHDGCCVAVTTLHALRVVHVTTGRIVSELRHQGGSDRVTAAAFSGDGRAALLGRAGGAVDRWDLRTGRLVDRVAPPAGAGTWRVTRLRSSPGGDTAIVEYGDASVEPPRQLRRLLPRGDAARDLPPGFTAPWYRDRAESTPEIAAAADSLAVAAAPVRVALSADGRTLAIQTGARQGDPVLVHLWDLRIGRETARIEDAGRVSALSVSADGSTITTGAEDGTVRVWNAGGAPRGVHAAGGRVERLPRTGGEAVVGERPARRAAGDAGTGRLVRRRLADGEVLSEWRSSGRVSYATGGTHALLAPATCEEGQGRIISLDSDQELIGPACAVSFDVSRDGRRSVALEYVPGGPGAAGRTMLLVRDAEGRVLHERAHPALRVLFDSSGRHIISGGTDGIVRMLRASDGSVAAEWRAHAGPVTAVDISSDGAVLVTASSHDGTVAVSDPREARRLVRLISFRDRTWAVVDDAGRFDASNGGDIRGLHWVVGLEPIHLDQLRIRYHTPGLLPRHRGEHPEPLRDVGALADRPLFPEVRVLEVPSDSSRVRVVLRGRGGGIGPVVVHVNGRQAVHDARPAGTATSADSLEIVLDLSTLPFVRPGRENRVTVRAFDAAGELSSRGFGLEHQAEGIDETSTPRFWALVVGVSDYEGRGLDLRYAGKDAVDFGRVLRAAADRYGFASVHVRVLSTDLDSAAVRPSRDRIAAALAEIAAQASPEDIVVVYLAGHGVVHGDDDGDYYFLTADADSEGIVRDSLRRSAAAISSSELADMMHASAALRQVLILDTCGAGRASASLERARDIPSAQIRSIQRMKERVGIWVLAGSAADAVSYEASHYGQGLLTYSLLFAMRHGEALSGQDVQIFRLFDHAVRQVPRLAVAIGGVQRPEIAVPRPGASFALGRLTPDDQARIALASPLPILLRASFQDETRIIDHLGLSARVNERLHAASVVRGSSLMFADTYGMSDGYTLAGRYRLSDSGVTVTTHLFQGGREVAGFEESGTETELDALAERITRRVAELLPRSGGAGGLQ